MVAILCMAAEVCGPQKGNHPKIAAISSSATGSRTLRTTAVGYSEEERSRAARVTPCGLILNTKPE